MYEVIIYTNIETLPQIKITVDDLETEEFKEIISQPYVIGVEAHKNKELTLKK